MVIIVQAGLSPLKMTAIQNLPLGTNAKIQLQFKSRVWYTDGFTATTYADNGADIAWEATNYQAGSTGILIDFPGGTQGAQLGTSLSAFFVRVFAVEVERFRRAENAVLKQRGPVLVICHGGPIAEPEDARFILEHTRGVHGCFGASSIERLAVERAITEQTRAFKLIMKRRQT